MNSLLIVNILLAAIAIILNVIGVYAIYRVNKTFYAYLLINLSATEILVLVHQIMKEILLEIYGDETYENKIFSIVMTVLYFTGSCEFLLTITIILISRTTATISPIKYMIYNSSPSKVKRILSGSWLFAITYGISFRELESKEIFNHKFFIIYFTSVNSLYIVVMLITYAVMGRRTKQSRRNSTGSALSRRSDKLYRMSTLIIMTFIVFYAVPMTLWSYRPAWRSYIALINHLGYICDPLIYIYVNQKYRVFLRSLFSRSKRLSNTSQPFVIRTNE